MTRLWPSKCMELLAQIKKLLKGWTWLDPVRPGLDLVWPCYDSVSAELWARSHVHKGKIKNGAFWPRSRSRVRSDLLSVCETEETNYFTNNSRTLFHISDICLNLEDLNTRQKWKDKGTTFYQLPLSNRPCSAQTQTPHTHNGDCGLCTSCCKH